jgi:hypothetical protein
MSKCSYKKYDSNKYLIYADVAENYPREKFAIASGKNKPCLPEAEYDYKSKM